MKAQMRRYSSTLSLTSALDEGWVVNATPRPLYPQERAPVPIAQEAVWDPRPAWTGAENVAPHRGSNPGTVVWSKGAEYMIHFLHYTASKQFNIFYCRQPKSCVQWVPITTAWRVLRLRMEERPPVMDGSCEYIE
jgi:hypothetical protein